MNKKETVLMMYELQKKILPSNRFSFKELEQYYDIFESHNDKNRINK